MIKLCRCEPTEIAYLRKQYLYTLNRPVDGFWEKAYLEKASHYIVDIGQQRAGYVVRADDGFLLQLYLMPPFRRFGRKLIIFLLENNWLSGGYASTGDPFALSLCLDFAKSTQVHSFLFEDAYATYQQAELADPTSIFFAEEEHLEKTSRFYAQHTPGDLAWFTRYTAHLIYRQEVCLLTNAAKEILAIGECRLSDTQKAFADLDVVVHQDYRRKNLATFLLQALKEKAYQQQRQPICSCPYENTPSRKAIQKAGFVGTHRLISTRF